MLTVTASSGLSQASAVSAYLLVDMRIFAAILPNGEPRLSRQARAGR